MWKQSNLRLVTNLIKKDAKHEAHIIGNIEGMVRNMSVSKLFYRRLINPVNHMHKIICEKQPNINNTISLNYCDAKSSIATQSSKESISSFRTQESDPRNHDERHLGRIYTMPGKQKARTQLNR